MQSKCNKADKRQGLANTAINFSMSENMPDMTILEFLSGIFKMFNLVCYIQSDINATYANYSANITNIKTISSTSVQNVSDNTL